MKSKTRSTVVKRVVPQTGVEPVRAFLPTGF